MLTAEAYGRRVGLRVATAELDAVRPWLPHWWVDGDVEPERVWRLDDPDVAEGVIASLELWVAEHAEGVVFVHAGVVAVGEYALLLPGRSSTGKTTLTAELLRLGADYGSDEYAVLDAEGRVHAYPRPLRLRTADSRPRVPAAEFGAAVFVGSRTVAAVASVQHEVGADLTLRPLSAGSAVLRLFDNTVCAASRPAESLDVLVRATAAPFDGLEGVRGEARAAGPKVLNVLLKSAGS